jgi:hypothetical protein
VVFVAVVGISTMEKVSANDQGKPSPFGDVRNSLSHLEFLNEPEIQGLIEEW